MFRYIVLNTFYNSSSKKVYVGYYSSLCRFSAVHSSRANDFQNCNCTEVVNILIDPHLLSFY